MLSLPVEMRFMIFSADEYVFNMWPILSKETAYTSRYNDKLEKHGKFRRKEIVFNQIRKIECWYRDDKLDGLYSEWYAWGQLCSETMYKNGVKHGSSHIFHSNGNLLSESSFKEGRQHGKQMIFNERGDLREERTFVEGRIDGMRRELFVCNPGTIGSNTQLCERKCFYKMGKKEGMCVTRFEKGNTFEECFYLNGKLHGTYRKWNTNGVLEYHLVYNEGVLVEIIKKK
mmetsp:Transcript_4873/g.5279  ORF Transcript_4873/g.5279 Transcript_4873/m.5279 type:complete len:229 (-) Transcript_4873:64-750(-)